MHTRFFLTLPYYIDPEREKVFAVGITRNNFASTHMPKKDENVRSTFDNCMERFARKTARLNNVLASETSLIFLDDTVTFQLETVAVVDNSYCTYNIDTKLIGFGSSPYEARDATDSKSGMSIQGSFNTNDDSSVMMNFNLPDSIPEFDKYSYLVTDAFYESVLNELIPYINHIKIQKFKNVTTEIIRHANMIDDYIDNFFEETYDAPRLEYSLNDFILSARMFIEDDPVLLQNKPYMESYYICMGILCRKMQELTNETF